LVKIPENLPPPTFTYVGHFLSTKYDVYINTGCYSPTPRRHTTHLSNWDPSLPAGMVMDHEQLHSSIDLLPQGIRCIYTNKLSGKNFAAEFNRISTAATA